MADKGARAVMFICRLLKPCLLCMIFAGKDHSRPRMGIQDKVKTRPAGMEKISVFRSRWAQQFMNLLIKEKLCWLIWSGLVRLSSWLKGVEVARVMLILSLPDKGLPGLPSLENLVKTNRSDWN